MAQEAIKSFDGQFDFLSNFYPSTVLMDFVTYKTVEHAYQAAKTLDITERYIIADLPNPGQAKRAGRKVKLRPDWESIKIEIMTNLVREKFTKHPMLAKQLLDTGDREIIEGNTWGDYFWGVCKGKGENNLGKILMKIRSELISSL